VDRNGRQVRYIIDFYFDESRAGSSDAFEVDARPALDSFGSVMDRTKMGVRSAQACAAQRHGRRLMACCAQVYVWCLRLGLPCPFSGSPPTLLTTRPA
jgi:cytochrome c heme-lyase